MKKVLWVALVAVMTTEMAYAERGEGPRGKLQRMQQHLNLTDDQVSQIREIRQNGGSREDVHAILTEDQLAQLEEHRAAREARRAEREEAVTEES